MQVTNRFISRKLVQRCYDRALAIGLKGYAKLYVLVKPFPMQSCEPYSLLITDKVLATLIDCDDASPS